MREKQSAAQHQDPSLAAGILRMAPSGICSCADRLLLPTHPPTGPPTHNQMCSTAATGQAAAASPKDRAYLPTRCWSRTHALASVMLADPPPPCCALLMNLCRREAERDAAAEPLLSSFLYASILAHDTFERALAFVLSNRLANAVMLPTQLFEIFHEVLISEPDVREGALADVEACRERASNCARGGGSYC